MIADDTAAPEMRDCPGKAGRGGDRCADIKPHVEKTRKHIVQQGFFAAEKMGTAGDIEKQAVIAILRHKRGVTIAPIGDGQQQIAILGRIFLGDFQLRVKGARFRQTLMPTQADRFRPFIERGQAQRIVVTADAGDGRRIRTPGRTPGRPPFAAGDPVGRQMREAERQNA